MNNPNELAETILQFQREIDEIKNAINNIAKHYISDFHFLDYEVSTFWRCHKSPIGMCVFPVSKNIDIGCRYCGKPMERK